MTAAAVLFPHKVWLESVPVQAYQDVEALFRRIVNEIEKPAQSLIYGYNVHAANIAHARPDWRKLMQEADVLYCDGAGIVMGARMLGEDLPCRLTAADWMYDLLKFMASQGKTVYFLGGTPEVAERALELVNENVPDHTLLGTHHGYILSDEAMEKAVVEEINRLQPDLLLVGFGMPIQEYWIDRWKQQLNVPAIWAVGATFDYLTGKVQRCPDWMGKAGMEWLFRLGLEPKRMFQRYVVGNPWFLSRMGMLLMQRRMDALMLTLQPSSRITNG